MLMIIETIEEEGRLGLGLERQSGLTEEKHLLELYLVPVDILVRMKRKVCKE